MPACGDSSSEHTDTALTAQHGTAQLSTARHSSVQHSTARHSGDRRKKPVPAGAAMRQQGAGRMEAAADYHLTPLCLSVPASILSSESPRRGLHTGTPHRPRGPLPHHPPLADSTHLPT
ncbi:hypothetical protein ACOMHN_034719 [Nucella lapillus]